MNNKEHRKFTPDEKVAILRLHLIERQPVSEICETHALQPSMFYRWQKQFFEQGGSAFKSTKSNKTEVTKLKQKVSYLEERLQTKNEVLGELMEEHVMLKKKDWGEFTGTQVTQSQRDAVVAFVQKWTDKAEWSMSKMLQQLDIRRSKYYDWCRRVGQTNEHNGQLPRKGWLTPDEKTAIVTYHATCEQVGYRRMTYRMLDEDVIAVSPSSVYRVLRENDCLKPKNQSPSKKGTGFDQPTRPHEHWHIDITYLRIGGVFYYMCSILDGYSRYIVHWEIRESMRESDIEMIVLRAKEKTGATNTRIISDNGPQFIAHDFKQFIRLINFMHVRTSPYYPQSNGKLERWHQTLKQDAIRPKTPLSVEDAGSCVADFVEHYNNGRLHSAISYITPADMLNGNAEKIFAERTEKLQAARAKRNQFWLEKQPLC